MKCCICHKTINGYGNNPDGALNLNGTKMKFKRRDVCCDKCNEEYVIPGRILRYVTNRYN